MKPVLIVYGTVEGHTKKIAQFISGVLSRLGLQSDLINCENGDLVRIEDYSAVILGAPVHISRYPAKFTQWVTRHTDSLSNVPTAFFSVCLGILQKDEPKTIQAEHDFVQDFFVETDLHPDRWAIFAGALMYSKYGWFTRHLMRMISYRAGRKTDTSKDYDFTDWSEVDRFATDFAAMIPQVAKPHNEIEKTSPMGEPRIIDK